MEKEEKRDREKAKKKKEGASDRVVFLC